MVTLEGRQLTRSFGRDTIRTVALRDVSLELRGGEFSLLVGPSGSGKSTLLAVLSGLLRPDNGQVFALEQDLWQMAEEERERFRLQHCGFIFQGFNLFPSLTVREQLEMVLRWSEDLPLQQARPRVSAMLDNFGLLPKVHLCPGQLSGGEKQRVAIARALIKDPAFCFADEPTSALDWSHGKAVIELLRENAHRRGACVLVVAHDTRIVPYADRVYHLEDGLLTSISPALAHLGESIS